MRNRIKSAAATVLLVLAGCGPDAESPESAEPTEVHDLAAELGCNRCNVVLISLDTLRADRLSTYGYHRPTSPQLDELAEDGIVFEQFFHSGGGTLPSHMTMMTSLNPITHTINPQVNELLPEATVTLADSLQEAGYATAGFADSGWMKAKYGFSQGFDIYDDEGGHLQKMLPRAYRWLDELQQQTPNQSFFLFVHSYDVHSKGHTLPYRCPGDFTHTYTSSFVGDFDGCRQGLCGAQYLAWVNGQVVREGRSWDEMVTPEEALFISDLYDGCIHWADLKVGELIDRLKEMGLYEDTLILVTSDHGEEFGEHGMFLHDQGGYEEYIAVPLIVKLPGNARAGSRLASFGATVDLMPTILDLVGVEPPDYIQGHSLVPTLAADEPVRDMVHQYSVLRTADKKLFFQHRRYFDLLVDPGEQENLIGADRPELPDLEEQVKILVRADKKLQQRLVEEHGEARPVEKTQEEIDQLKALGYLQ